MILERGKTQYGNKLSKLTANLLVLYKYKFAINKHFVYTYISLKR